MSKFNQAFDPAGEANDAPRPHVADNAGATAARDASPAALIMDCYGTVRHCSPNLAWLFHTRPRLLIGRQIRELIPNLPLSPTTPGYNAAYATFWARHGQRRGFHGVDSYGRKFGLRVALVGPKLRTWGQGVRARRAAKARSGAPQQLLYCLCQPE